MKTITKKEFDLLTDYIIKKWGISLDDSKISLMEYRLGAVVEKFQLRDYEHLYQKAQTDPAVATAIISAISTNETFFFRDEKIFDMIKGKIIPEVLSNSNALNIWSAACSYGQEVYTLAIMLKELRIDPRKYKVQITGTDIKDEAIAYASHGIYTEMEVNRGLSQTRKFQNFTPHGNDYKVNDDLRVYTYFQKLNLMHPIPSRMRFDLVLCRNVAIYFNMETKRQLFERIANAMTPKGILLVGSSEMLFDVTERFDRKEHSRIIYYQLKS
ncbi:MAG: protein-glutamate O-methyltransferase CheR [SAR324 cluster bacterium]|nr:protein-glutamate O-methyltransferase CheR [SAR324 cluster bacterium]